MKCLIGKVDASFPVSLLLTEIKHIFFSVYLHCFAFPNASKLCNCEHPNVT